MVFLFNVARCRYSLKTDTPHLVKFSHGKDALLLHVTWWLRRGVCGVFSPVMLRYLTKKSSSELWLIR